MAVTTPVRIRVGTLLIKSNLREGIEDLLEARSFEVFFLWLASCRYIFVLFAFVRTFLKRKSEKTKIARPKINKNAQHVAGNLTIENHGLLIPNSLRLRVCKKIIATNFSTANFLALIFVLYPRLRKTA